MTRSGEFHWISTYLAPLAGPGAFALKDDAALLIPPGGKSVVITQDAIASGIHFLADDPLDLVARKALRVNISDIVAKGATPHSYSLALGVPDDWTDQDMALFASGLAHDQQHYQIQLTGGDTYRSPERLTLAVTMFGLVEESEYVSRLGAQGDDCLFVTGTIGDAALGLKLATGELETTDDDASWLLKAYRLPDPPVAAADPVRRFATAAMDVSDGLIGDCRKLCEASEVSAVVERSRIPLSGAANRLVAADNGVWPTVYKGGDDYQVLCTVSEANRGEFLQACNGLGVRATQIGVIEVAEKKCSVALDIDGTRVSIGEDSFSHF